MYHILSLCCVVCTIRWRYVNKMTLAMSSYSHNVTSAKWDILNHTSSLPYILCATMDDDCYLIYYTNCMLYYTIAWHITPLHDVLHNYLTYYITPRHVTELHDVFQNYIMSYTIIWHVTELYDILHNYMTYYRLAWRITEWYDILHDHVTHYRIIWYITQLLHILHNYMTIAIWQKSHRVDLSHIYQCR